jgi:hypothetical protein
MTVMQTFPGFPDFSPPHLVRNTFFPALCLAFRVPLAVSHRASYPTLLASLHSLGDQLLELNVQSY